MGLYIGSFFSLDMCLDNFQWIRLGMRSLFFSTFSINISLCLIHCSIKLFLLMSLLLRISVLSEG